MATGMAVLLLTLHLTGPQPSTWALVPGLIIVGIGMGLVAPTLVDVALSGVHARDAGSASGVVTSSGQLGCALGVAAIGAVFFGALPHHETTAHQETTASTAADYTTAFTAALYYETGLFALAALLMLLLPRTSDRRSRLR